jgi:hypothetical protein
MLVPGLLGARLAGALLVYDSHELATSVPYRERTWAAFVAAVERLVVPRCAAVITVSLFGSVALPELLARTAEADVGVTLLQDSWRCSRRPGPRSSQPRGVRPARARGAGRPGRRAGGSARSGSGLRAAVRRSRHGGGDGATRPGEGPRVRSRPRRRAVVGAAQERAAPTESARMIWVAARISYAASSGEVSPPQMRTAGLRGGSYGASTPVIPARRPARARA